MANNTPKLNLLKKDPAIDGNETFNIKTMLNDNWDKIDVAVGDLQEAVQDIHVPNATLDQAGIVQLSNATNGARENVAATEKAVKTVNDSLIAHLADNATLTTKGHVQLSNATSGTREDVAATEKAVGLAFQAGNERKAEVVAALIAIGVPASTLETWAQLIPKIAAVIKATGDAVVGDVLSGKPFSNASANGLTGTMPNQGAKTFTINTQGGQYTIPAGYHNGGGRIAASFANLVPENIKSGVNVGDVVGSLTLGGYGELNTNYSGQAPDQGVFINVFDFPPGIKYFSISPEGRCWLSYAYKYGTPGMRFFLAPEPNLSKSVFTFLNISGTPDANFYVNGLLVDLTQGIAYISGNEDYSSNQIYRTIGIDSNYDPSKPQKLMVYLSQNDGGNPYSVNIKGKLLYF